MSRSFRISLSILSGVLLSLAWLGFPGWVLFIAFLPLLALDHFFIERKALYRGISFWGHAFLAFLIWNGLATWWIAYATVAGAFMAVVVNAFLMSLVFWLGHAARRYFRSTLGYLALVAFWISFEYFHYHWDIEWPWLNLGNGFSGSVKIIQWYEYTGVLGGSIWILIINVLLFRLLIGWKNKSSLPAHLISVAFFLLLLLLPAFWSLWRYNHYSEEENPMHVVIVQPNIDPYYEAYDPQSEHQKMQKIIELAEREITEETELVIGPETVFERYPDWNVDHLELNLNYRALDEWLRNYPRAELILGTSTSRVYAKASEASVTARKSGDTYYDVYNSALFISRNGQGQVYHKSILVSGVEKMPFRRYLGFLNDLVFNLGGTTGSLGRQDEPRNFVLNNGIQIAPVICYESVFGGYLCEFIQKGATFIVVITNDGWWRDTPGYKQHLAFSRLRAIETRRSVARSANTGISAFINQRGDLLDSSSWWEEAVMTGTLNGNERLTFYVKHGDYPGRVANFIAALLLLFMIVKKVRKE